MRDIEVISPALEVRRLNAIIEDQRSAIQELINQRSSKDRPICIGPLPFEQVKSYFSAEALENIISDSPKRDFVIHNLKKYRNTVVAVTFIVMSDCSLWTRIIVGSKQRMMLEELLDLSKIIIPATSEHPIIFPRNQHQASNAYSATFYFEIDSKSVPDFSKT